jgi:hypothetical protein
MAAYQQGQPSYIAALNRFPETRRALSGWRDVTTELQTIPSADQTRETSIHVFFGSGNVNRFVMSGWSTDERSHRWAIARTATLQIPLSADVTVTALRIRARALAPCPLSVVIEGQDCGSVPLDMVFTGQTLTFAQPIRLRKKDGLTLTFSIPSDIDLPDVEPRSLTFAIKSLDFTCAVDPA